MKCHASPATSLHIKENSPLSAQHWREGELVRATSEKGSSHDKYVRDLTDSIVLGMVQISANSMHSMPVVPHPNPRMLSVVHSHSRQMAGPLLHLGSLSQRKKIGKIYQGKELTK